MTTTASKLFLTFGLLALASAAVYGWGTGGGLTGVLLLGFKGGVGELAGYTVLVMAGLVLLGLGAMTSVLRDADPERQAAIARLEVAPAVVAPTGPSYWPVLGAFCAVLAAVGLVASPVVFVIGLLLLLLVVLEWMVKAWSERASGDSEVNRQIRNRLMYPIEVPVFGAVGILVLIVSFSRVFLALDKIATVAIAVSIGAIVTGVAFTVAYRPTLSRDAIAGLVVVLALVAIGGGIASAAVGSREFEHHEVEGEESEHQEEGPGVEAEHGATGLLRPASGLAS